MELCALETSWNAAWRTLGLAPPPGLAGHLLASYAEAHRRYHTLQHLRECLTLFEQDCRLARRPAEVAIALWFHDAIYDTARHDNEAESAGWARRALIDAGAPQEVADRVHALVMATRHDEVPATEDAKLLVDIDLAILGAEPARFAEYERQIRDEYGHVPQALFDAKRAEILQAFETRRAIYSTPTYIQRFEAAAKANLRRALAAIRGAAPSAP